MPKQRTTRTIADVAASLKAQNAQQVHGKKKPQVVEPEVLGVNWNSLTGDGGEKKPSPEKPEKVEDNAEGGVDAQASADAEAQRVNWNSKQGQNPPPNPPKKDEPKKKE